MPEPVKATDKGYFVDFKRRLKSTNTFFAFSGCGSRKNCEIWARFTNLACQIDTSRLNERESVNLAQTMPRF